MVEVLKLSLLELPSFFDGHKHIFSFVQIPIIAPKSWSNKIIPALPNKTHQIRVHNQKILVFLRSLVSRIIFLAVNPFWFIFM